MNRIAHGRPRAVAIPAAVLVAGLLAALAGCATTGPRGQQSFIIIDTGQEVEIGKGVDQNVRQEYKVLDNAALQQYVQRMGASLASHSDRQDLEYHFAVLDDPMVNAFAAPGGYIYVTTGLMRTAENEAELAGVIAHEIGHVVGRHSVRQMQAVYGASLAADLLLGDAQTTKAIIGVGTQVLMLKNSRENELESDEFGIKYTIAAGYDPRGLVTFFEKLLAEQEGGDPSGVASWLSTHPTTTQRIDEARQLLNEYAPDYPRLTVGRDPYLQATASLRR